MREILRKHHISFQNALAGIFWSIKTQPNFRIHLVLSSIAILLGIFLRINNTEMAVIIFTIILGLSAEMINTSIEAMTDLIIKEWREEAKIAKDVSAGMMLTTAIGAVIIACNIFVPRLIVIFLR
jgi:diacylglycerol kinase (ATP)